MDRFASNTLRTIAIVLTSIGVIIISLVLLLLGLCFGLLSGAGGNGHRDPQAVNLFFGFIGAAIVLVIIGAFGVAKLARGIVRESAPFPLPAPTSLNQSSQGQISGAQQSQISTAQKEPGRFEGAEANATARGETRFLSPSSAAAHHAPDVIAHLSPASRNAIQHLVLAIAAQIAAEIALSVLSWQWVRQTPLAPFRLYVWTRIGWSLATTAPYLILLFSLLRRPGRRPFAYALIIPAIHVFFGFFGHPVTIFYTLRAIHSAALLFSMVPWILDILIFYLAWKAIRLTGIQPTPTRLIVAAAVIFLYNFVMPILLVLNLFRH